MIRETGGTASMAVFCELRWQTSEPAGAKAQTLTAMFSAGLKPSPVTNLFDGNGKKAPALITLVLRISSQGIYLPSSKFMGAIFMKS